MWSLLVSRIPDHTDLHPGRNVYLTSWFILSVLFLTFSEMSVVPTHVQNPPSHRLHPGRIVYLTSWVILSVLFLTGCETICSPYLCPGSPMTSWFILSVTGSETLFLTWTPPWYEREILSVVPTWWSRIPSRIVLVPTHCPITSHGPPPW